MAKLRSAERKFCQHHGIPECRIFDATGLRPAHYREIMKLEEKWVAYNVTPCAPSGHQLRNRHGTCMMCDTQRLAYLFRSKLSGFIYVASGAGGDLMKIGFSTDPENRLAIANYVGWGGYSDWCLRAYGWAEQAGRLEHEMHARFAEFRVPLYWYKDGCELLTREAYEADIVAAVEQLVWLCDSPPEIVPPPYH